MEVIIITASNSHKFTTVHISSQAKKMRFFGMQIPNWQAKFTNSQPISIFTNSSKHIRKVFTKKINCLLKKRFLPKGFSEQTLSINSIISIYIFAKR